MRRLIFNLSFSFCFIYFFILIHVFFRSFLSIFSVYPMPETIATGDFLRIYLLYIKCRIFRSEKKRLAICASRISLRFCCYTIFFASLIYSSTVSVVVFPVLVSFSSALTSIVPFPLFAFASSF